MATNPGYRADMPRTLLNDRLLLVILFVAFRVMLLMVYQPLLLDGVERGIGVGGDALYYHQLARFADDGLWPFRDWWHEFPPIPSHLFVAVHWLAGGGDHINFTILFGLLMLACDTGNLLLIRNIGAHLHGPATGQALGWIYAVLLAPAVFLWWNFEPLVVFWTLLGLWWLLVGRSARSAVAIALGALTKFTPALVLAAVWRYRLPRRAVRYTLITLGLFALVYALFLARSPAFTLPSLTAQASKASYQSIWALIDGNYRTGNFGTVASHRDPAQAAQMVGNPPVVPAWLRLGVAALVGFLIYARARRFDDRGMVAFIAITFLIFFLQSQGWSPQWLGTMIPFVLLCFPTRNGVLILVLLSALVFAEYPVLFMRTGDTDGVVSGTLVAPYTLIVVSRTALLVGLVVALYRELRRERAPEMHAG